MYKKSTSTWKRLQECPLCQVHQGVQQFLVTPSLLFHHLLQEVPGLLGLPKTKGKKKAKTKPKLSQASALELLILEKSEFWIFRFDGKLPKADGNFTS